MYTIQTNLQLRGSSCLSLKDEDKPVRRKGPEQLMEVYEEELRTDKSQEKKKVKGLVRRERSRYN